MNVTDPNERYVCPECGAPIQATVKLWLSMDPTTGEVGPGFDEDTVSNEIDVYCVDDCDLTGWAFDQTTDEPVWRKQTGPDFVRVDEAFARWVDRKLQECG